MSDTTIDRPARDRDPRARPQPPVTPGAREVVTRRAIKPNAVLWVACAGAALAFLDATIVNIAFPDIRESFPAASLGGISWVLNAYNIVFAA